MDGHAAPRKRHIESHEGGSIQNSVTVADIDPRLERTCPLHQNRAWFGAELLSTPSAYSYGLDEIVYGQYDALSYLSMTHRGTFCTVDICWYTCKNVMYVILSGIG
jgi:hypothetical protein